MRKYYIINAFAEVVYIGEFADHLQAKEYVDSRGLLFIALMDEGAAKNWLMRCKAVIR